MKREGSDLSKQTLKGKSDKGGKGVTERKLNFPKLTWTNELQWSVIFWLTVVIIFILLLPSRPIENRIYQPGDIAFRDIKATQSYLVEDPASTQARKLEAEASVISVYDYDRRQQYEVLQKSQTFFQSMRELLSRQQTELDDLASRRRRTPKTERPLIQEEINLFIKQVEEEKQKAVAAYIAEMALEITPEQFAPLIEDRFSEQTEEALVNSFQSIQGVGIVTDRESLLRERGKGISVRTLNALAEEVVLDDFTVIMALENARDQARKGISSVRWTQERLPIKRFMESLIQDLVRSNFTFNRSETEERKRNAVEEAKPVYHQVKKGEIIVRSGDPLSDEQILKIGALGSSGPGVSRISVVLGTFLFSAIVLFAFFQILKVINPWIASDTTNLLIIVLILVIQVALVRSGLAMSQALTTTFTGLPEMAVVLGIPFAMGAMIAATLFPTSVGLVFAALSSIFGSVLTDWNMSIFIYSFVGAIVASFSVINCRQRSSLIKAGLLVSWANIIVVTTDRLLVGELMSGETLYLLLFSAVGGVLVSLFATMVIPLIESGFNVATDMKLMELANLNQPVLKEMIIKAPGSYHHSVLVGSLAEAAAEEIGANDLLTRVAASYHDIGKMNKPEYFIENQEGRNNRHEKLTPSMSSLILTAHVKDGAEIAMDHRLPRRIVDIIKQHHGTKIITFFYNKAKEMSDPSVQTVDEMDFRYPGPKPQSREAALIMLSDAVEAASKVLDDPTPARIRGLVQKIINDIFVDGQLDESNLTLRDLHQIARSFTRTITGILHHRIDYPESPTVADEKRDKNKEKKNGPVSEPNGEGGAVSGGIDGSGVKNIKRLGQS